MRFTLAAFGILMLAGSPPALAQTPDPRVDECKTANPDRQLDVCQKVLASVPKPPNGALVVAHNGLCSAFRQKGDLDRAVAECSEALKIAPDNWTAFWTRGFAYQNKRDFDHAIADFTSAVKFGSTAPDFDPGVYYHRAESQAQKGRYEDTVADYSAYLRLRPNDVNARNARGFNNLRLGRADAAIEDFGAAIQTNPKWQVSFYNRGLAWIKKGDDAKALADLDEAIRIQPAYPAAHVERGNLYLPKGDAASAYGDFDAAVSVTPRYQAAIDGRDQALTRLKAAGKPVPNAPAISAAGAPSGPPASTTPPDPRLLETCQTGPPESRIEACGRLLVAVPPPPAAALAAAHDSLCESYRLKNVMDKSLDECQQAIALEPANWAHYWQRGVTYEEKGQSIPAIADFTAAEQRGADAPDFNPEVYYHRGSLYRDKGQFDEARQD